MVREKQGGSHMSSGQAWNRACVAASPVPALWALAAQTVGLSGACSRLGHGLGQKLPLHRDPGQSHFSLAVTTIMGNKIK